MEATCSPPPGLPPPQPLSLARCSACLPSQAPPHPGQLVNDRMEQQARQQPARHGPDAACELEGRRP
eukprot:14134666-Heterocapsa_arctica.AAC.1